MKVLFAGFDSGDSDQNDVSWSWLADAAECSGEEHLVKSILLPASWDDCFESLRLQLNQGWDAVICVGSKKTGYVAVERVAINETDASVKDKLGRRPRNKIIDTNGDTGIWTGLPYRELSINLENSNIHSLPSHSAGGGLPNFVFYQLVNWISHSRRKLLGGLIQVPEDGSILSQDQDASKRFVQCILDTLNRTAEQNDSLFFALEKFQSLKDLPKKHSEHQC